MDNKQRDPANVQTQLFIYNCTLCASFVILYYDYFLTIRAEYNRYWLSARKFTLGWTLFFINRYVLILGNIPVMYLYFWSGSAPDRLQVFNYWGLPRIFLVVSQVAIGSAVILRTHAIYSRSRRILFLLIVVAVAVTAYGMHSVLVVKGDTYSESDLTSSGCLLPLSSNGARGLAESWSGHVIFDTLVFLLTLYKSLTSKRAGFSILTVMLRDGTIYFGVMVLASISVILSFESTTQLCPDYLRGMTSTTTNVLSSTMISRLMLNLRDPHLGTEHDTRQREEIILSNLVFKVGAEASKKSNKSFTDEEWAGLEAMYSNGGIYISEDLPSAHWTQRTHPNKADTFQSVAQLQVV